MTIKPDIAVIVPVFNGEKYIGKCVKSVQEQTLQDYILVLIDDGSTDSSSEICDTCRKLDSRIYVIHQDNKGLSGARNTGIDWVIANTECTWITFIDSDDYIKSTYLQRLYELVCEYNAMCSVVGFSYVDDYDNDDEQAKKVEQLSLRPDDAFAYYTYGIVPDFSLTCAWGKLFHRSLFNNVRFPAGRLMEDRFTTYRLLFKCSNLAISTEHLYMYYQTSNSIIRSEWNPGKLDELDAFEEQLAFFRKKYPGAYKKTAQEYLDTLGWQLISINQSDFYGKSSYFKDVRIRLNKAIDEYHEIAGIGTRKKIELKMNGTPLMVQRMYKLTISICRNAKKACLRLGGADS